VHSRLGYSTFQTHLYPVLFWKEKRTSIRMSKALRSMPEVDFHKIWLSIKRFRYSVSSQKALFIPYLLTMASNTKSWLRVPCCKSYGGCWVACKEWSMRQFCHTHPAVWQQLNYNARQWRIQRQTKRPISGNLATTLTQMCKNMKNTRIIGGNYVRYQNCSCSGGSTSDPRFATGVIAPNTPEVLRPQSRWGLSFGP